MASLPFWCPLFGLEVTAMLQSQLCAAVTAIQMQNMDFLKSCYPFRNTRPVMYPPLTPDPALSTKYACKSNYMITKSITSLWPRVNTLLLEHGVFYGQFDQHISPITLHCLGSFGADCSSQQVHVLQWSLQLGQLPAPKPGT